MLHTAIAGKQLAVFHRDEHFKARRNCFGNIIGPWDMTDNVISPCKSNVESNLYFVDELKHKFWKDRQS